jgi:hypothetical protein
MTQQPPDDGVTSKKPRTIMTQLTETGPYTVRVRSLVPLPYFAISATGSGPQFTVQLNEKSPIGADKVAYLPVELNGFMEGYAFFIYVAEISADSFEPTAVLVDKKTMKPWPAALAVNGKRATLTFEVDGFGDRFSPDLTLVILVKPAKPGASPKPKGTVTVNVRFDHAEGS